MTAFMRAERTEEANLGALLLARALNRWTVFCRNWHRAHTAPKKK